MLQPVFIPLIALLLAGPATTAGGEPATTQATLEQLKHQSKAEILAEVVALPVQKVSTISDVLQLTLKDNFLHATTSLPAVEETRIQAPGLDGITTFSPRGTSADGEAPQGFLLRNIDFNTPDGIFIQTEVSHSPQKLMISQDLARTNDEMHSVQLLQAMRELEEENPRVSLYIRDTAAPQNDQTIHAESLPELRRANPAAVARYVDPIFRKLNQGGLLAKIDPRLAWQVFGESYKPDEALRTTLATLLAQLGAENFSEREAASTELEKLGQPAALALMKWDRERLSEEQISRIDAFIAQFKPADDAEIARLRKDPDFLLDCLYSDDAAVRKQALEALRKVTGRSIEFDVDAQPAERLAAIEQLRESIGKPPKRATPAAAAGANPGGDKPQH